jgi:hypothetical protein
MGWMPSCSPGGLSASHLPASQAPLSVQEMLNIVKAALSYNALSVEDGFHSFDADQDGRISFADLEAVCSTLQLGMSSADVWVLHTHLDRKKRLSSSLKAGSPWWAVPTGNDPHVARRHNTAKYRDAGRQ